MNYKITQQLLKLLKEEESETMLPVPSVSRLRSPLVALLIVLRGKSTIQQQAEKIEKKKKRKKNKRKIVWVEGRDLLPLLRRPLARCFFHYFNDGRCNKTQWNEKKTTSSSQKGIRQFIWIGLHQSFSRCWICWPLYYRQFSSMTPINIYF